MTVAVPLSRQRFQKEDFSGQDFSKRDLSYSEFIDCNFDNCDLSEANCEGSVFNGSSFRNANMYRVNGKDAKFANTDFTPRDCYGITLTFDCFTFQNVRISQLWWFAILVMVSTMQPIYGPVKEPLRDNLIALIGVTRYAKLVQMLKAREI